jgi:LmbE family N-acetylglucosaminyl deacetylase
VNKKVALLNIAVIWANVVLAQTYNPNHAAKILHDIKKLAVSAKVLYIAAHPDDENTRLLGYLANERKVETAYLSLTRGDGGQNLVGNELGIDLGLIRTQELLSARSVDGAQQFFTRAYDFGFSKSPEEAIKIWGKEIVLADVVWVIRKFRPDVIIARFPTTGEGGHGHHTASAILAEEAFDAAASPNMFAYQLSYGVQPWQAKRLLWNTFNFNGNNTQRNDQLKIDCGNYNNLLGVSYGEMAAESRSRHKSQGFGVPAQRGKTLEYFKNLRGEAPTADILDGIEVSIKKIDVEIEQAIDKIIADFKIEKPFESTQALVALYKKMYNNSLLSSDINMSLLLTEKAVAIKKIIEACSGIFMEASTAQQLYAVGDSLKLNFWFNNRNGLPITNATVSFNNNQNSLQTTANENNQIKATYFIPNNTELSQPYWLEYGKKPGYFDVKEQTNIGLPEKKVDIAKFEFELFGEKLSFEKPIMYKYTDDVRGELHQPFAYTTPAFINITPNVIILKNDAVDEKKQLNLTVQSNIAGLSNLKLFTSVNSKEQQVNYSSFSFEKGSTVTVPFELNAASFEKNSSNQLTAFALLNNNNNKQETTLKKISYNHVPDIIYHYKDVVKVVKLDVKTVGKKAGYIAGAGDKIPEALVQLGYDVVMLSAQDITADNLKNFDVIVTGIRAYNIHTWLNNAYSALMQYVKNGGVLFVQYNTNSGLGPVKASIAPFSFTIGRNRITDETAQVNFLQPKHDALNYPNKITQADFEGWVQERSIYHADKVDSSYAKILSMKDPNEAEHDGSLIVAKYGKGKFIYTGLVFFRELPAAVPGAYRLFANLIAKPKK